MPTLSIVRMYYDSIVNVLMLKFADKTVTRYMLKQDGLALVELAKQLDWSDWLQVQTAIVYPDKWLDVV